MSGIVEWAEPALEPGGAGTHARVDHGDVAKSLRANPGAWAVVRAESNATWVKAAAGALASNIRRGANAAYLPPYTFESLVEDKDGMLRVYARYTGDESTDPTAVSAEVA